MPVRPVTADAAILSHKKRQRQRERGRNRRMNMSVNRELGENAKCHSMAVFPAIPEC